MLRNLLLSLFVAGTLNSRAATGDVVLSPAPVNGEISDLTCTISNDLIKITIDTKGQITSCIFYKNGDGDANNAQELMGGSGTAKRAYFSLSNSSGEITPGTTDHVYVKTNTADQVEVQYTMHQSNNMEWTIGYIVRRGVSGIYNYAIMNAKGNCNFEEARMGFRGSASIFNYAYVNDDLQAPLPDPARLTDTYKVTDATYELADGSIYTKYDYAAFQKDDYMHGMMGDHVGIWMITPTVEWLNGGPMRQDLTVHGTNTTPIVLRHFHGNHLGGVTVGFKSGDQKVYGPHLMYINSSSAANVEDARAAMIADAKTRTEAEKDAYPYSWLRATAATMFGKTRGTVSGQIAMSAEDATYFGTTKYQVILAQTGKKPMLQGDGCQFWAETDESGNFTINKVRPGTYSLWVYALNGSATGYYEKADVTVTANKNTDLGTLTWTPDKYGRILWQIGEANHLSSGFNLSGHKREYGLWNSVPSDLTYTIGTSNPATDWWYAQGHPDAGNNNKTVWTIKYNLAKLPTQPLRLTLATAGAANLKLTVKSNTKEFDKIEFVHDGSVTRSATLAGRDSLFVFDIPVGWLTKGENSLTLTGWGAATGGIMYDCIKLEQSSDEPALLTATSRWDFKQFTKDDIVLVGDATNAAVLDCDGLMMHVYSGGSHKIQASQRPSCPSTTIGGTTYSGTVAALYINANGGSCGTHGAAEAINFDGYALDLDAAGTFEALVQNGGNFVFSFNGTDVSSSVTTTDLGNSFKKLSYHATGAGTLYIKGSEAYHLVAAAFEPDAEAAMTKKITISAAGYATFSAAQHYTLPAGLTAYRVSDVTTTQVTLEPVTVIPAGTGVVLKGAEGTYTLTSTASAEAVGTNYLVANLADYSLQEANGSNYNYTLAAGPTFKHANGSGKLAGGKAFLRTAENASNAPGGLELLFDDGNTTGINTVQGSGFKVQGSDIYYNLAGQRVTHPTRGLYIVNGKKIIKH